MAAATATTRGAAPAGRPGAADADLRAPRCRLTLVDVPAGAVAATSIVCRPGERVDAVALAGGPADGAGGGDPGPVAYLAIRPLALSLIHI